MTRYCDGCRQHRPIRDFDLGGGYFSATCRACSHERASTEKLATRSARHAQIASREAERRALIVTLVKVDAGIVELADRQLPSQTSALERQRRSVIAALVKIDAEIAELRARPSGSAPFERVEPADVLDGADADAASDAVDADLGFGD